jgi:S1-C subfamily serine protease
MVAAFVFLGSITAGAAAGVVVVASTRVTPAAGASLPPTPNPVTTPPPSTSAGAGGTSAVAAKVDPAVVDVTTTLAGGAGTAKGTGIILTSSGEVLTNNHVISGAAGITVQIDGAGRSYTATVVGYDATDDIAVLQIQGGVSGLTTVSIGDSSALSVGQSVLAIGNALGVGGTPAMTSGQIPALQQSITAGDAVGGSAETLTGLIQMNALIQPGDSGGPLVDASGNVVGIDTAGQSNGRFQTDAGSTTGYAIPINAAVSIARQIESGGGANITVGARAVLGVQVRDTSSGATVVGVESASPAEAAGLHAGDVIVGIGGSAVTSTAGLQAALSGRHAGDSVQVAWLDSAGQQNTATVQLESGPPA